MLHDECTVNPANSMVSGWIQCVLHIATYHNLYAIINVVAAFVAMESVMLAVHRIRVIPLVFEEL